MAIPLDARHSSAAPLLRVATLVVQGVDEDALFAAASEEVAHAAGAQTGAVLRYLGEQRAVIVGAWRGPGVRGLPVNAEVDFEEVNSAIGRVWSTRRPARVDSYAGVRGELPVVMQAVGLRGSVAAPILVGEDVWGAVVVATTSTEPLPHETEYRLTEFAELVAHAVAGSEARRSLDASRRRIVEAADEARRRLERSLHEGHQQHLLALALELRLARERAEAGSELATLLDSALVHATDANASLRELARAVYPAVLSERGLAAALQALTARAAVPVRLCELPKGRYPPLIEATAYFAIAEALANAARHAHAAEAELLVGERGSRLVAELRDDGIGGARLRPGAGLAGLADRVAAVGGRLDMDSPRGGGTVVRVEIPLER